MERIDELLEKATPNLARRERLRNIYSEWERAKSVVGSRDRVHIPILIREEPQPDVAGVVISAVDAEEFKQIREELADAGVPAEYEPGH
ncbi:hypothetical protein [Longimicrobium sp.]|jgi:hypothetical protein|uniref:hypothetical protein n=1 Tax=Longimicrobium sp. TaxID=2029185 RepID=UPI002F93242E